MSVVDLRFAFDSAITEAMSAVDPDRQPVGPAEVAEMCGMSKRWVYETFSVEVPPMKIGNRSKWFRWQVHAYLDAKHQQAVR